MKKMFVLLLAMAALTGCGKEEEKASYQQIDMDTAIQIMGEEE